MAKEILCGFGVDVDAVAGWLGSYGGEDSPDDISRGLFAGEVGSPRLLKLFGRLGRLGGDDHGAAGLGQSERDRPADAAAGAGHDRHAILQLRHHELRTSWLGSAGDD